MNLEWMDLGSRVPGFALQLTLSSPPSLSGRQGAGGVAGVHEFLTGLESDMQTLTIYSVVFDQDYYTCFRISLINH